MLYGQRFPAGIGYSTVLAVGDFETYSEAGYIFTLGKWKVAKKNAKSGLDVVGAWEYSRHPTTEVSCFGYDLKEGRGRRLWHPGKPNPQDLFDHTARGYLFEAYNSFFEWCIWNNVCVRLYGWPALSLWQVRDVQAKSSSWTIPGSLENVGAALNTDAQKSATGKTVMRKLSKPRTPTNKDPRQRFTRAEHPEDFAKLDAYCLDDVRAEDAVSLRCADLSEHETEAFLLDQVVNARGICVDRSNVDNCIAIIEQAETKYNAEVRYLTNGTVETADKVPAMKAWLRTQGVVTDTLEKEWVAEYLKGTTYGTPVVRRVLQIRQVLGSKSVQKTYALAHRIGIDDRVRGLFKYCGAGRTWRFAGVGPQPQNLPAIGPDVKRCGNCKAYRGAHLWFCPQCWNLETTTDADWCSEAAEECLKAIRTRNLANVEALWGDPLTAVAGCLRSLFCATTGYELICSDYSALEAVILAVIAGEEWRIKVFQTHGKIYEECQSRITGVPLKEILAYRERTGSHHPDRKGLGKIPELASGYGGGLGAWRRALHKEGADDLMTDEEIERNVKKWRKENPAIVAFWYGVENAALSAVENPGQPFSYKTLYAQITYQTFGDVLYCFLPSGRAIPYHSPKINYGFFNGRSTKTLSYLGMVKKSWVRIETWSGHLTENIVQALQRDVFVAALIRLEATGYPIVLHVHDEAVAEVLRGFGSIEHFEAVMMDHPLWCRSWPIFARGGWRGSRYRKE